MSDEADGKKILRAFLDSAVESTQTAERRQADPVSVVREYDTSEDREIAALICACLAYGRVDLVRDAARRALAPLGPSPARTLRETEIAHWPQVLDRYVYRMTRGADLADLYAALRQVLQSHGSLEALYVATPGSHLDRASAFVQTLRAGRIRTEEARGLRYLLVDPADGSAAKRMHMFFRWVARPDDGVDLGLWSALEPADLVMPLDTHTSRISRYIGLTTRKSTDLKAAQDVTESLAALRPEDPLYYDFALAHLGIGGSCIHRRSEDHCPSCPLEAVCRL